MAKGYFKLKVSKEGLSDKSKKRMMKVLNWSEFPIENLTLNLKMDRQPTESEITKLSKGLDAIGVDISQIKAQWIPE